MRRLILSLLFVFPVNTLAAEEARIDAQTIVRLERGRLSLLAKGEPVWSTAIVDDENGDAALSTHPVAGGSVAVHVRVSNGTGGRREAVFLLKQGRRRLVPVWEGSSDLAGDIGERTGQAVRFEDLNGDGRPEIVLGAVSETVRLCGKEGRPLLFRHVYDLDTERFRPVLAKRVGLGEPVDIKGTVPGTAPAEQYLAPLMAACASRSLDDQGTLLFLSKPLALVDGDDATAWFPWPPNGAGEFVTLDIAFDLYGITAIGIRQPERGDGGRKLDRLETLLLKTETELYRLSFLDEAAAGTTQWFALPSPLKGKCLSLIVESTARAGKGLPIGIAEVVARTEIDGPEGLARLAADLGNPARRRQAAILLERVGKPALPAVTAVWDTLDVSGRRLALSVVGAVDPEGAVALLVDALLGDDEVARQQARRGLARAPNAAVAAIVPRMEDASAGGFTAAVETVTAFGNTAAYRALMELLGGDDRERRAAIGAAVRSLVASVDPDGALLWSAIERAHASGEYEKTFVLMRIGATVAPLRASIRDLTATLLKRKSSFADRYRLLSVAATLGCDAASDSLLPATQDADPQVRALALSGFASCRDVTEAAIKALHGGLDDAAIPVRLAALEVLAVNDTVPLDVTALRRLLRTDPWPVVRAGAAEAIGRLPEGLALPLLERAVADESPMVRRAGLDGARRFTGARANALLERPLADPDESPRLVRSAIEAVAARCQQSALPLLAERLAAGAEPLAPAHAVETAVAAARAMGRIGTPEAARLLAEARRRSNPTTDKAIEEALTTAGRCAPSE